MNNKRKGGIIAGICAAVIVVAGVGFFVWHEQPSFCSAICHTPMDSYVEDYYSDDTNMLAVSHRVNDVSCLQCHVPTISQQLSEGVEWVSGGYEVPLAQRHFDNDFCMNGTCHDVSLSTLATSTARYEYNPHSAYHEELDCGSCHKSHSESVMTCAQCHSGAEVPAGWVVR